MHMASTRPDYEISSVLRFLILCYIDAIPTYAILYLFSRAGGIPPALEFILIIQTIDYYRLLPQQTSVLFPPKAP